ncbi:MAG: hypothetical protein ACOVQE_08335 [Chitinophagaceae bacterium]
MNDILLAVIIAVLATSLLIIVFFKDKLFTTTVKTVPTPVTTATKEAAGVQHLKIQAYERLVLLADRIALPNLITRLHVAGSSAVDMQMLLMQTIKQEFEYNVTQQIYVSAESWNAIKQLRDQNLLVVNAVMSALSAETSATDYAKIMMEYLAKNQLDNLHELAAEVIAFEAKKLM